MVAASKKIVPIMADCSKRGDNAALGKKYNVRGYPTVVFTDANGKEVQRLRGRDAASVKAQIEEVAEKFGTKLFLPLSLADAKKAAKEKGKFLAVVFVDKKDRKAKKKNAMMEAYLLSPFMEEARKLFIWIERPLKDGKKVTAEAKGLKAKKSPTLVIYDPEAEKILKSYKKANKKLGKTLVKLIAKTQKKRTK